MRTKEIALALVTGSMIGLFMIAEGAYNPSHSESLPLLEHECTAQWQLPEEIENGRSETQPRIAITWFGMKEHRCEKETIVNPKRGRWGNAFLVRARMHGVPDGAGVELSLRYKNSVDGWRMLPFSEGQHQAWEMMTREAERDGYLRWVIRARITQPGQVQPTLLEKQGDLFLFGQQAHYLSEGGKTPRIERELHLARTASGPREWRVAEDYVVKTTTDGALSLKEIRANYPLIMAWSELPAGTTITTSPRVEDVHLNTTFHQDHSTIDSITVADDQNGELILQHQVMDYRISRFRHDWRGERIEEVTDHLAHRILSLELRKGSVTASAGLAD